MTLNQIFDLLKKFAGDHLQINDFGKGPEVDILQRKDQFYPSMWAAMPTTTYSGNALNHRMRIIFYDLLSNDKSNELEIQSDMLTLAMDLVSFLNNNPDIYIYISGDPSFEYGTEQFTDWCAGVILTINIKDPKPLDRCEIPFY